MSLVFAVEVELNSLTLKKDVIYRPSLSIKISDNEETIFPWEPTEEESQNPYFEIKKTYQIMVSTDVFNAAKSWPITFNVSMRKDQVITGSTTYEFRPMLASALALCGRSKSKKIDAILKDQDNKEVARLNLVATVEYLPGNEHTQTVEVIASQPITIKEEAPKVYKPKMESSSASHSQNNSEVSQSDVSVDFTSSSVENPSSGNGDDSLLQGHSSFRTASQSNRSKISSYQKNTSTIRSQQTATGKSFTTDFVDDI